MDKEVKVTGIQFPDKSGGLTLQAKSPAFALLAAECVRLFKAEGGVNYCEWTMSAEDPAFGLFTVIIQRAAGKTPAQRVVEVVAERDRYKAALEGPLNDEAVDRAMVAFRVAQRRGRASPVVPSGTNGFVVAKGGMNDSA